MAVGKGPGPAKAPKVDTDDLLKRWEADKKSRLFLQLAEEYRKQDQVDAAIGVLREGLKHHATFQPAHVALARCLVAKGQLAQAQAELEPVLKKAPDNILAGKLLAEVLAERGEKQKALAVLKALLPFSMNDAEVGERLAELQARLTPPKMAGEHGQDTAEFTTSESNATAGGRAGTTVPGPATAGPAAPIDLGQVDFASVVTAGGGSGEIAAPAAAASAGPAAPPLPEPVFDLGAPADLAAPFGADADDAVLLLPEPEEAALVMPAPAEPVPADLLGAPHAPAPAGEHEDEDEFASLTLADLYESQGATAEAAVIYERLLARKPGDPGLRRALERCRSPLGSAAAAASVVEAVATPPPTVTRPRWEPVRSRSSASTPPPAAPIPTLAAPPPAAAPAVEAPAPVPVRPAVVSTVPVARAETRRARPGTEKGAGAVAAAKHGRRTVVELRRWLTAIAAVRQ